MKTVPSTPTSLPLSRARRGALAFGLAALSLATASTSRGAAPWGTPIMEPGIAAVSCAVPQGTPVGSAFTFALFDLRTPATPHSGIPYATAAYDPPSLTSQLWNPPAYHHPSWTITNIGNVYGVAIDADGDMYTAAHGLYAKFTYFQQYGGLGGWYGTAAQQLAAAGTVYKIDRNTGVASVFAVIPGQQAINLGGFPVFTAGPGLGNIAFDPDPAHGGQFFVTSLENGNIYRLDSAGAIIQTYDPNTAPLAPASTAAGMPPVTDRIWGIGVSGGAVFYSVWNDGSATSPGKIRRVPLLIGGAIDTSAGMDVEVLTVPFSCKLWTSPSGYVPVTDITFSADGTKMVLGERTMTQETSSYNHDSRVHIAELVGAVWTVTKTLIVGNGYFPGGCGEAYGGVAFGPENGGSEQLIWMTSADMAGGPGPHGIYGVRPGDFPPASSPAKAPNAYRVPFDPSFTTGGPDYKGSGGDVEIMPTVGACCVNIAPKPAECIETNMTYLWQMCVTNCWTNDLKYFSFVDLPTGVTLGADIITLPTALKPGQGVCLNIYVTNSHGLTNACFLVGAHTTNFLECCSITACITFSPCCLYLSEERLTPIYMTPPMANCYNFSFLVKNVTVPPTPMTYLFLVQDPPAPPTTVTFNPQIITFNPPLLPGQSMFKTVKACFAPGSKGPYYFLAGAHNSNLVECCSVRECIPRPSIPHPISIGGGLDGAVVLAGSTIDVPILLDTSVVRPSRVTLYEGTNVIDGLTVDPVGTPPVLTLTWSNATTGTRVLSAELLDVLGGVWTSEPATVFVEEEPPFDGGGIPAPVLFVPAAALTAGQVRFLLQTEPGVTCFVEYTDSLSPADWKVFQTIVGDGTVVTVIDSVANASQRFFRVRMP